MQKRFATPVVFKDGQGDEGLIEAVVSTFGILDADREIVVASAFTDGQAVPLIWGHNWAALPIGRGIIRVDPDRAVFSGKMFLDTSAGADAYRTMKGMAELQQFSWGFSVKKSDLVTIEGEQVRRILETDTHEVSAVLVGSNPQTGLLALKSVLPFDEHAESVRVALTELVDRIRSGSDLREKEGRPISTARRARMATVSEQIRAGADEIDALLLETAPQPKQADLSRLRFETDRLLARTRRLGVPV